MARAKRANANEQKAYSQRSPKPLYPLYGSVRVSGKPCHVEYLNEGRDNPNYEVLAPDGFWFYPDGVHSLLCFTLDDLDVRTDGNTLEADPEAAQ